jgi:hypothetical protein
VADDRMAVLDTVRKALADGDVDFLREMEGLAPCTATPSGRAAARGRLYALHAVTTLVRASDGHLSRAKTTSRRSNHAQPVLFEARACSSVDRASASGA